MTKLQIPNNNQYPITNTQLFGKMFGNWNLVFGYYLVIGAWLLVILSSSVAHARPPSGFHEGPYFLLAGGIMNFSADNNARTGARVGDDIEPGVGFHFGWNLRDYIAPELQIRYTTNRTAGNREQVVNVNLNGVYTLVTNHILPFIQAGPIIQFAAIPGDPLSPDQTLQLWGPGLGLGAGVKFLFYRYGYAGFIAQSDFVLLPSKSQDIGGTSTKIMAGGWDAQIGLMGMAGVHF